MQPSDTHEIQSIIYRPKIPDDVARLIAQFSSFEALAGLARCNRSLHELCTPLLFQEAYLYTPKQLVKLYGNQEALGMLSETKTIFLGEGLFYIHLWADFVEGSDDASHYLITVLRAATSLLKLQVIGSPESRIICTQIITDLRAPASDPTFLPQLEVLVDSRAVSLAPLQLNRSIQLRYFYGELGRITYPILSAPWPKQYLTATKIGTLISESKGSQMPKGSLFEFIIEFPDTIESSRSPPDLNLLVWLQEVIKTAELSSDCLRQLILTFNPPSPRPSTSKQYAIVTALYELLPTLEQVRVQSPFFTWYRSTLEDPQDSLPLWTPQPSRGNIGWWYDALQPHYTGTMTQEAAEQIAEQLKQAYKVRFSAISKRSAEKIGVGVWEINAYSLIADTEAKTEGAVRARFEQAALCAPCVFLIRHIEALVRPGQGGKEPAMAAVLAECIRGLGAAWGATGYPVAVVATTAEPDAIPVGVMACFRHEIVLEAPDERRRLRMLNTIVTGQKLPLGPDVELSTVARETAALHAGDLVHLVRGARDQALKRVLKELSDLKSKPDFDIAIPTARDLALAVIPITARDFESALDGARAAYSESIGAPKIPNVSWDDVGGLAHVKGEILDTIQLPLEHPELFADGMKKRSGILLYGPPGTGKTLLAKAVATSCALNFLSVKGPELLNMYIGESEANVRRVFQRARDARPCVVFFDELDSIAPRRGQAGDSGGVMDRIVSQILAELDGMGAGGSGGEVFVIGATNRPDLLDPALLRPGRFDRMLYLGVSKTHQDQLRILQALTRKFKLDPSLDLAAVAERCPFNYTGADFYALCSDAMLKAMARKAEEIERRVVEINSEPPLAEHSYPMTAQYYLAELATPAEVDVL
ncbi:unnamed protein product, partial [Rhizoctonia solani]